MKTHRDHGRRLLGISLAWLATNAMLAAPIDAQATVLRYDVTATYRATDFFTGGPIFGVNLHLGTPGAADYVVRASFTVDTDRVAFFVPANTPTGGSSFPMDVYGFRNDAIGAFDVSFGTRAWTADEFIRYIFPLPTGIETWDLLIGGPPSAPTGFAMQVGGSDGALRLGRALCGGPCFFEMASEVQQSSPISTAFTIRPSDFTWTVTRVSAVPEPATLGLLGAGLLTLVGMRRRPSRTA